MQKNQIRKIKINITGDKENYEKELKKFWKTLMDSNQSFCKILEEEETKWKQTKINFEQNNRISYDDVYFYVPEKVRNKSPITFFNGDWGSGKSHFFEKLIELSMNDKQMLLNENTKFKKIVIIDLWNYINNENMIDLILNDCYEKIFTKKSKLIKKLINYSKKIKTNNIKISKMLKVLLFITKCILGNKKMKLTIEEITKETIPTILVFENIERLENKAVEIIKLMQKLSILKNLIIIFPLAKNKIYSLNKENELNGNDESSEIKAHWLDKYVTLGVEYEFSQEFISYIQNMNINGNDETIKKENEKIINEIFLSSKLDLRIIDSKINYCNNKEIIQKLFEISKYHAFYYIEKEILQMIPSKMYNSINNDLETLEYFFNNWVRIFFNNEIENEYKKLYEMKDMRKFVNFFNIYEFKEFFSFFNFKNHNIIEFTRWWMLKKYKNDVGIKVNPITENNTKIFIIFYFLNINNFKFWLKTKIKNILEHIINENNIEKKINYNDEQNLYINEVDFLLNKVTNVDSFLFQLLTIMKLIILNVNKNISIAINEVNDFKNKYFEIVNFKIGNRIVNIGLKEFNYLEEHVEEELSHINFLGKIKNNIENDILNIKKNNKLS